MQIRELNTENIRIFARIFEHRPDKYDTRNKDDLEVLKELERIVGKLDRVSPTEFKRNGVVILWNRVVKLGLYKRKFFSFPECITQLKSLTHLDLGYNLFNKIPDSICQLKSLRNLNLEGNLLSNDIAPEIIRNCPGK